MATPEARALVERLKDIIYVRDGWQNIIAAEIDRFAAQRGAEAARPRYGEPACSFTGEIKSAPPQTGGGDAGLTICNPAQDGTPSPLPTGRNATITIQRGQTGGGDATHPIDGWTPEIMAEEARRFDEGLPAALDQFEKATGGGDAGERAHAIVQRCQVTYDDGRGPSAPSRIDQVRITTEIAAALRSSHREGAEEARQDALRAPFTKALVAEARRQGYREGATAMRVDAAMAVRSIQGMTTSREIADAILALPIPGKTE